MKVLREKLLPVPLVVKLLEEESKRRNLSSIETVTLEYGKKFAKLSPEAAEGLMNDLIEKGLPVEIVVQIVNVMPESESELRTILAPLSKTFTAEEIKEILDTVISYRK